MCGVPLSTSAEAWGSSGILNGEAMADILAVLMGSSLLHIHTVTFPSFLGTMNFLAFSSIHPSFHPSYLGLSLSLDECEDRSDWRDLLSSGGE